MMSWLSIFLGRFLGRVVKNYIALLRAARVDDEPFAEFILGQVREAEASGADGLTKQRAVRVAGKKYWHELGREVATVGIDALILTSMQELGLVHPPREITPPDSARTLGSTP